VIGNNITSNSTVSSSINTITSGNSTNSNSNPNTPGYYDYIGLAIGIVIIGFSIAITYELYLYINNRRKTQIIQKYIRDPLLAPAFKELLQRNILLSNAEMIDIIQYVQKRQSQLDIDINQIPDQIFF
jgi:hypothetical protein